MALSATMEGDTTVFYISKRLKDTDVKISILARGVAIGANWNLPMRLRSAAH